MPPHPHSLHSGPHPKGVGYEPGYVYLACSTCRAKKRKCIHPHQNRPTRMKKACKACRTHKIKCCPEHHIVKSRIKKVVAKLAVAVPKSPEMLLNQIDNKIISPLALSAAPSWLNFTSEEWEQFLADSFNPATQLPLPHFPAELEPEKEPLWHHPVKGLGAMLESSSSEVTFLDVNTGFGIEAEAVMTPILTDFSSGLGSQMCNDLNTGIDNWEGFFGLQTAPVPNVSLGHMPCFPPGAQYWMQNFPSNGMNEMMNLDMPNSFDLNTGVSSWDGLPSLTNHSFIPSLNSSDHWSYNFGPPIAPHTFPQELLLQQPVLFPALNEKAMDVDDYEREGFNQSLNFSNADDYKGSGI